MKFAKELEEDLVPEWRVKYFSYKIGKKKIKAVSRALRNVNRTPRIPGRPQLLAADSYRHLPFTRYDFNKKDEPEIRSRPSQLDGNGQTRMDSEGNDSVTRARQAFAIGRARRESVTMFALSPPNFTPARRKNPHSDSQDVHGENETESSSDSDDQSTTEERQPLQMGSDGRRISNRPRYGSIVASPPLDVPVNSLPTLLLPDPALDLSRQKSPPQNPSSVSKSALHSAETTQATRSLPKGADVPKQQREQRRMSSVPALSRRLFKKGRSHVKDPPSPKIKTSHTFAALTLDSPDVTTTQVEAFQELDARQKDFFDFLDKELNKVEIFYKAKEEEAASRLEVLREQLHEMRDRRLEDLRIVKAGGKIADDGLLDGQIPIMADHDQRNGAAAHKNLFELLSNVFRQKGKIGRTSKAREQLGTPRGPVAGKKEPDKNDRGDYVRRQQPHEKVPYRFAKRKLKLALQEFYRGLELLKSYALLNRTAFRKINKKYDKAVMARPPLRYVSEKVNMAHFVTSTLVEETLVAVEDLYARYFERGNRKVATNKLRSHLRSGEYSSVAFRNGLYVAAGTGFAVSGIVRGAPLLFSDDPHQKMEASYLFQLYAGYFFAVLLFILFALNCRIWARNRINYIFVFEYDTRHTLDWRQLAELPCFFLFLNGLFLWLNFQLDQVHAMYIYWPVILIGLTTLIMFLPFKILYYRARKWWLYSNWRLLLAGLYPVEFRDFYLGDMYCSETYTMSQLEIFFCIYARRWNDPAQCNSSHSRVLGFLTALPAIWRAFQCIRRYYDSRKWFPHLANLAKYCCNILYYMSLSLFRIDLTPQTRAVFIAFALVNGLYCGFWDVFMDFSLGSIWSKNFLLRDNLAFRRKWYYYAVMVADVLLRQQWIFYAIFTADVQHSAVTSFFVALAEVVRRGLWSLFRVENEHCNNVQQFRASRDIPLPYSVAPSRAPSLDYTRRSDAEEALSPRSSRVTDPADHPSGARRRLNINAGVRASSDLERANTSSSSIPSRRDQITGSTPGMRALQRVGTAIAAAHTQDFEKRRRPDVVGGNMSDDEKILGHRRWTDEDDEEDGDDDDDEAEEDTLSTYETNHVDSRNASSPNIRMQQQQQQQRQNLSRGPVNANAAADDTAAGESTSDNAESSGSNSGSRAPRGRDREAAAILRQADEMDDIEIDEVRERVNRARH